jgi:hypothetical protein
MGIKVEEINNGNGRRVLEDFTFADGYLIEAGYSWDGASVPRIFQRVVRPFKYLKCSARHDHMCSHARRLSRMGFSKDAKSLRSQADAIFRDCITSYDGKILGAVSWLGVRFGSLIGSGW